MIPVLAALAATALVIFILATLHVVARAHRFQETVMTEPKLTQPPARPLGTTVALEGVNVRALHDRVLVRRARPASQGLIVVPEQYQAVPVEGTVLATGPQVDPLEVGPGDQVVFAKHAGLEVRLAGEQLLVLKREEVLLVLTDVNTDGARQPAQALVKKEE